eukprot:SAG31_NODE_3601_length_4085_cov_1.880582_2_plen_223_part_00
MRYRHGAKPSLQPSNCVQTTTSFDTNGHFSMHTQLMWTPFQLTLENYPKFFRHQHYHQSLRAHQQGNRDGARRMASGCLSHRINEIMSHQLCEASLSVYLSISLSRLVACKSYVASVHSSHFDLDSQSLNPSALTPASLSTTSKFVPGITCPSANCSAPPTCSCSYNNPHTARRDMRCKVGIEFGCTAPYEQPQFFRVLNETSHLLATGRTARRGNPRRSCF